MSRPRYVAWVCCAMGAVALCTTGTSQAATLLGLNDSSNGELYEIKTDGSAMTFIRNVQAQLATLEYNPLTGLFYGYTRGTIRPQLYSLDPKANYAPTWIAEIKRNNNPVYVFEGSLAFSPQGVTYGVDADEADNNGLFTLDLNTGAMTPVATLDNGTVEHDINGMVWWDNSLVGLDQVQNAIIRINPTSGATSTLWPLGSLNENGSTILGGVGGMTLIGNVAYFTVSSAGDPFWEDNQLPVPIGSNSLYSIDLGSGAVQHIRTLPATATTPGINALAVPEPATLALLGLGCLAVRTRRRR